MAVPETIPLFPLNKVLFPRMVLPLHIFEQRYKTMFAGLINGGRVFGVIHTDDVNPDGVGTTARVQKIVNTYDDGRLDLITVGEKRFRLHETLEDNPYLTGRVEFIRDTPFELAKNQADEMLRLYKRFISRLGLKSDQLDLLESLVEEMTVEQEISYIIGQTIGLDSNRQQELLKVTDPGRRIQLLTDELNRQNVVHNLARTLFEGENFDPSLN